MPSEKENDAPERELDRPVTHTHILMSGQQFVVVRHAHAWRPPTDVMEDEDRMVILVEVAGMQHGEFHISLSPQRLTISGTRPVPEYNCTAYHQLEVRYGEFRTDVTLPWLVDENGIRAQYEDGFLRVELPRARAQRVRVIPVDRKQG